MESCLTQKAGQVKHQLKMDHKVSVFQDHGSSLQSLNQHHQLEFAWTTSLVNTYSKSILLQRVKSKLLSKCNWTLKCLVKSPLWKFSGTVKLFTRFTHAITENSSNYWLIHAKESIFWSLLLLVDQYANFALKIFAQC